ncbi:MAG: slipin family protein [Planctomycetota bacterium]|jgi:regulator of protease activity HflC (stomatin/prohibitin superfamily)
MEYIVLVSVIVVVAVFLWTSVRRTVVFEYEKGMKYVGGRFEGVLEPGAYWHIPFFTTLRKVDVRPRFISIVGQEVLSSDGVTLKVSLAAKYQIADPDKATHKIQSYEGALYLELQLALRQIIGGADIDSVLSTRSEMSKQLVELTASRMEEIGLTLLTVSVKDIMFPGALKEIFAQVVNARQEGLASLERARGETAALRHLANAAKMLESNPNLMSLRVLQTLGESSGNTLVLGMPAQEAATTLAATKPARDKGKRKSGAKKRGKG